MRKTANLKNASILIALTLATSMMPRPLMAQTQPTESGKETPCQVCPKTNTKAPRPLSVPSAPVDPSAQKAVSPKIGSSPDPASQPSIESKKASLALPASVRLVVTRKYPWATGAAIASFSVTETSGFNDVSPLSISLDPFTEKSDGHIVRADLSGKFDGRSFNASDLSLVRGKVVPVEVHVENAREVGIAETKLVFRSPQLASESTVKLEAVIRDYWLWALLAVFLGTLFSYLALDWESVRRPLLLLKIESERIEEAARLVQRLHPDKSQALEEVYKALRDARHFIDLSDEAKAKEKIEAAQDKLNQISEPAQAAVAAATIPLVSVLNYRLLQSPLQNLRSLVAAPTQDLMIRRVRVYDRLMRLLAVLIVTLLGLQAVYQNQPFGGWDYGKAFLWGFGIDQTVKGFGPVLSKLRGR